MATAVDEADRSLPSGTATRGETLTAGRDAESRLDIEPTVKLASEPAANEDEGITSTQDAGNQQHTSPSPAEKVFETVELAEMILSLLPLEDNLSMVRVCRATHDIISSSKPVQQNLCVLRKEGEFLVTSPVVGTKRFTLIFCHTDRWYRWFRLTALYAPSAKRMFDLNFSLLSNPPMLKSGVIFLSDESNSNGLWRKIRWVQSGLRRGGSVFLEKRTSKESLKLPKEDATLGGTWEALREMAEDEFFLER
ncbi:hypothetical protein PRZ48_012325 [Zasmidium cellare]|uniref:F-box domain-containing protein n=1 Tax=Zasmidium cellare TaxID=395010 RepID=A0ABR0E511_ZASCE|nr:hypothetical protein PRZ48_012325 [Zasmidium cellare]